MSPNFVKKGPAETKYRHKKVTLHICALGLALRL